MGDDDPGLSDRGCSQVMLATSNPLLGQAHVSRGSDPSIGLLRILHGSCTTCRRGTIRQLIRAGALDNTGVAVWSLWESVQGTDPGSSVGKVFNRLVEQGGYEYEEISE